MKLYIETVGCQMNVLDSELVVASLRKDGYELTRERPRGRHDPVQHLQRPPARRGQDLQRPRPAEERQAASIPHKVIGVMGCMAQKDQQPDLQAGAVRRPGRRPGPVAPGSGAGARDSRRRRASGWKSASAARTAAARRDRAEPRKLRPAARSRDAADAVSGVRADHDRLRQVLHLLHRAERPRPGAKPPAGADPRRGAPTRRRRLQGNHAARARRSTATATAKASAPRG